MGVLSQEERALILQGSGSLVGAALGTLVAPSAGAIATAALAAGAGVGTAGAVGAGISSAIGGFAGGIVVAPAIAGLASLLFRPEFPQLSPADILRSAKFARQIRERGLEPLVATDPFTGNVALATRDQLPVLPQLLEEAFVRSVPSPSTEPISSGRQELIRLLQESAVERGFFSSTADIPTSLRGGVFRATADSPIQFVQQGALG